MTKKAIHLPYLFLALLIGGIALFYSLGFQRFCTIDSVAHHQATLLQTSSNHPILMGCLFTLLYALITVLCLPFHVFFMLIAGYLFFYPLAILYSVVGSTLGATCLFYIVRGSVGQWVRHYLSAHFFSFSKEVANHAANYLLFLRMMKFLPVTLINLLPAFFSVSISTYIWTSIIGSIPAAIVYCHTGESLSLYFDPQKSFDMNQIVSIKLQIALSLLGFISLFPIGVKHLIKIIKKMKKS